MRCLPEGSAGLSQYRRFLRHRFDEPAAVCRAYAAPPSNCSSWATLRLCGVHNIHTPKALADDYDFLPEISDQVAATAARAIRRSDRAAIIFGDTLVLDWATDGIISRAGARNDGQAIQPPGGMIGPDAAWRHPPFNESALRAVHILSGRKPLLIADLGFAFPRAPYSLFEWGHYATQSAAAERYREWAVGAA